MRVGTLLLCASCLPALASAQAQQAATLVLEFEEGFDGLGREGPIPATVEGQPKLVPGRFGQALLSGPGTGYLHFPTRGVVLPIRGTVEAWVCPVDWAGTEEKFHVFFDVRGEGALYLYKYYQQTNLLMLSCPAIRGPYYSADLPLNWEPGQWHHIAGTWSSRGVMSYVDGRPLSTDPVPAALPVSLGATFRIGDNPWHLPRRSSSTAGT